MFIENAYHVPVSKNDDFMRYILYSNLFHLAINKYRFKIGIDEYENIQFTDSLILNQYSISIHRSLNHKSVASFIKDDDVKLVRTDLLYKNEI